MELSDAVLKQPAGVSSGNSGYAKVDDSSSDESDTRSLSSTPIDKFSEVTSAFEYIIDLLRSEPPTTRDHPKDRLRQAEKLCQNLLSMVLAWGCDIRIDGDNLDDYKDTIIGYVVQTSLGQIGSGLRSMVLREATAISVDLDRLLAPSFRVELLDSISCLQSQVKAIRMSQAMKYGSGPLDGLAKGVEMMSQQYTTKQPAVESEDSSEPIIEDTPETVGGRRTLRAKDVLQAWQDEKPSLALPLAQAEEYGSSPNLDPGLEIPSTAFDLFPLSPIGYEHMKIDLQSNIRLLILCRGKGDDKLVCSMTVVPFVGHQLQYTAISHVWGSESAGGDIWVRNTRPLRGIRSFRNVVKHVMRYKGFLTSYKFPLRQNTYAALKHLRREDQDLLLWVDALCIDRHDQRELEMQVEHMADIFQGAKEVSVWLGEGNKNSDMAFSFIQENLNPIKDLSVGQRSVLDELLRNQLFRRLWKIQELALAKKAWLHCGTRTIEWVEFSVYVERIYIEHAKISDLLGPLWDRSYQSDSIDRLAASPASLFVRVVKDVFEKSKDGKILDARLSLEYLVYFLSGLEVSDPRDTIYALLSIAKDTWKALGVSGQEETNQTGPILRPNYSKDSLEVYTDFTIFCIQSSGSMDVLCRHWAHETDNILPSWTPRLKETPFDDPKESEGGVIGESLVGIPGHSKYDASFGTRPRFRFRARYREINPSSIDGSRSLGDAAMRNFAWPSYKGPFSFIRVDGVEIDKVKAITPRVVDGIIRKEFFLMLRLSFYGNRTFGDLNKFSENLCRILVADRGPNGRRPPSWYQHACFLALHNINGSGNLDIDDIIAKKQKRDDWGFFRLAPGLQTWFVCYTAALFR
ncbi:hypothetical protein MMC27_006297 [Xylographa pallens]|nr:hypothetical protein [Xylographa pallens]